MHALLKPFVPVIRILTSSGKTPEQELASLHGDGQHVDMSKRLCAIAVTTHTPNGLDVEHANECLPEKPITIPSPTAGASPELSAEESRLAFFVAEFNEGKELMNRFPRSSFTPIPDQITRRRQYRAALEAGQSLVREPSTDLVLLLTVLRESQERGLIVQSQARIHDIQQRERDDAREVNEATKRAKATARLAKAAIELSAAYEAALPFYRFPLGPCVRGVPTDMLRNIHNCLKNVKRIEELV